MIILPREVATDMVGGCEKRPDISIGCKEKYFILTHAPGKSKYLSTVEMERHYE
jgi:hypothetical protein